MSTAIERYRKKQKIANKNIPKGSNVPLVVSKYLDKGTKVAGKASIDSWTKGKIEDPYKGELAKKANIRLAKSNKATKSWEKNLLKRKGQ